MLRLLLCHVLPPVLSEAEQSAASANLGARHRAWLEEGVREREREEEREDEMELAAQAVEEEQQLAAEAAARRQTHARDQAAAAAEAEGVEFDGDAWLVEEAPSPQHYEKAVAAAAAKRLAAREERRKRADTSRQWHWDELVFEEEARRMLGMAAVQRKVVCTE
jgi:hypothetical protein